MQKSSVLKLYVVECRIIRGYEYDDGDSELQSERLGVIINET